MKKMRKTGKSKKFVIHRAGGAAVAIGSLLFMNLCTIPSAAYTAPIPGDVDCSGSLDMVDVALLIDKIANGAAITRQGAVNADINKDNIITYEDVALLINMISKEIPMAKSDTMLPEKLSQVVNEVTATYDTLNVDREAKQSFEQQLEAVTDIPIINITTNGNSELILSKEIYTSCTVDLFNVDKKLELDEVSAGIRVRGNSSAYYGNVEQIKKNPVPYRIKFDKKTNMLGLNNGAKCKNWVLLKSDWDLIRNDIALRMGRAICEGDTYCSDSQLVHLYVNDKFQGIYVLCEQNQVNKYRVDIDEPDEGYTGLDIGYYLELDNYFGDDPYVSMDYEGATVTDVRGTRRKFVPAEYSIKNDVYTQEQVDFISKYLNNVFKIIYNATEKGVYYTFDRNYNLIQSEYTNPKDCISAVIDVDSVVDLYLLYEIVHDYDCGEGSFYMCADFSDKSKPVKLKFTSPWDFNWAYNDSTSRYWAGTFCEQSFANQYGDRSNPWFILLAKQDWFKQAATEKWTALKAENAVQNAIEEEKQILETYRTDLNKTEAWAVNNAYTLIDWINRRLTWMDKTFTE